MAVTLKLQDAPYGRSYHLTVKLLVDGAGCMIYDRDLTPVGRDIMRAVNSVTGVDGCDVDRYGIHVHPAVAFDAAAVHAEVVDAIRAVVAELGDTLEVETLPPIPPPTPRETAALQAWPWPAEPR